MADWVTKAKPITEFIYFIAGIGLLPTVIFAYFQLRLVKKDMKDRSKRACVEKSIEYLNFFVTILIPKLDEFDQYLATHGVTSYNGEFNKRFRFDQNCRIENEKVRIELNHKFAAGTTNLLNQFEYFSAALLGGLADEELTFNPLSKMFCTAVENNYVALCFYREDETTELYSHTVELYNTWNDRIAKNKMKRARAKLDAGISGIPDKKISSIGG